MKSKPNLKLWPLKRIYPRTIGTLISCELQPNGNYIAHFDTACALPNTFEGQGYINKIEITPAEKVILDEVIAVYEKTVAADRTKWRKRDWWVGLYDGKEGHYRPRLKKTDAIAINKLTYLPVSF